MIENLGLHKSSHSMMVKLVFIHSWVSNWQRLTRRRIVEEHICKLKDLGTRLGSRVPKSRILEMPKGAIIFYA